MEKVKGKTPKQWVAIHERMHDPPECEHGHLGCSCSSKAKGPCMDEMLALAEHQHDLESI